MSASTTLAPVVGVAGSSQTGQDGRIAMALWPGESRRFLTNPIVMGAFAFAVLVATRFGPTGIGGFAGLVFGLFVFLAANLSASRSRRDRMAELYESLPSDATARTASHVLALIGPALAVALLTTGVWLWDATRIAAAAEPLKIWDAAQGPLLVIVFGAVGVALARWVPLTPAALPGVVGLTMLTGGLASSCGTAARCSTVWFGLWVNRAIDREGEIAGVRAGSPGWHLVYLTGLILVISAFAMARDRRGRAQIATGMAGLAMIAVAGILQLP